MSEEKELTKDEIAEAIEKKRCPYCKGQKFAGLFHAYQEFDFSKPDASGRPIYSEPDLSDSKDIMDSKAKEFRDVWCESCKRTTPAEIWSAWKL